jgi:branched-chain amino acid transport system substrate-binding protein
MGGVFMTDPIIQQELGDRILGVVTAGSTSGDSQDPAYAAFVDSINAAWPDFGVNAPSIFLFNNWANTEAVLQAIEANGGYDDPAAVQATLAGVVLQTPFGEISLDENRQAIGNNYLQQLQDENGDGVIEVKTLATAELVDQTFAGAFSTETPTPDRTNPECVAGTPGPWTEAITPEALGG